MAWTIRFSKEADKALRKIDKALSRRIVDELRRIALLDDPYSCGKALTGNLAGLWRYRVGDYRIVCDIRSGELVVIVVDVGHRSDIYRRKRR